MDSRARASAERQLSIYKLIEDAMSRRDEVFHIVDSSQDCEEARRRIRELFGVGEPDISRAVLDLTVSRWTRVERQQIADKAQDLRRMLNA